MHSVLSAYCNIIKAAHCTEFSSLITARIFIKMMLLTVSVVPVVGCCEYGNEHSGCTKGEEFLERLVADDDFC